MMGNLQHVLSLVKNNTITVDQTILIDDVLRSAKPEEIALADVPDVLRYIDLQLAHNSVIPDTRKDLELLYEALRHLRGEA